MSLNLGVSDPNVEEMIRTNRFQASFMVHIVINYTFRFGIAIIFFNLCIVNNLKARRRLSG